MTQLQRGQGDDLPESVVARAEAVSEKQARSHPHYQARFETIAAARAVAIDALSCGADNKHYSNQLAIADRSDATELGRASLSIARYGFPVPRDETPIADRDAQVAALHQHENDEQTVAAREGLAQLLAARAHEQH